MRLDTPAGQPSRYRVDAPAWSAGRADRHRHRRRRVLARRPRLRGGPARRGGAGVRARDDLSRPARRRRSRRRASRRRPGATDRGAADRGDRRRRQPAAGAGAGDAVRDGAAGAGTGHGRAADAVLRQRRDPPAGLRHRGAAHTAVAGRALSAVHARRGNRQPALRPARPDGVPRVARRSGRHVAVDGVAGTAHRRRRRRLHADAGAGRSHLPAPGPRRHPSRRQRTAPGAVRAGAARRVGARGAHGECRDAARGRARARRPGS